MGLLCGALIAVGLAAPADGARPLPGWAEHRGDRAVAAAWRAIAEQRAADAVAAAERATALQPDDPEAWHVRCRAHMAVSDWAAALEAAEALRRFDPASAPALELLGRAAIELGSRDLAYQAFSALDGLQHDLPGPRVGLALISARLDGDDAAAVAHLAVALARDPSLDLSGLLLRPHWQPLADDAGFVEALSALLQR